MYVKVVLWPVRSTHSRKDTTPLISVTLRGDERKKTMQDSSKSCHGGMEESRNDKSFELKEDLKVL